MCYDNQGNILKREDYGKYHEKYGWKVSGDLPISSGRFYMLFRKSVGEPEYDNDRISGRDGCWLINEIMSNI